MWAADGGHTEAVSHLLAAGADPNCRGYLGATALGRACRGGHAAVVRALVKCSSLDCLDVPNDKLQYPLHCAAFERSMESVRHMLDAGASTTVLDRKGRTPAEDTSVEAIRAKIREAQEQQLSAALR